ncbi:hypothetical protein DFJ58DRAFT_732046 [Suillus subalutaceus]|uniref:uncharacterized protein n=1 Tax=Suillus subalutaceus TaxID=48586 RepID=UPI001B877D99|nr:uncharacterized protein DFJ58DRAFT_732046 [Suillus subalutaceus]KAG1842365.1 hypothetical protein DFJ58DRAFT_732046 [Suillus subalutaceus]
MGLFGTGLGTHRTYKASCPNLKLLVFAADIFYECPQVSPRRPSEYWLQRPGWIDGAIDPPHFYISQEEIDNACRVYGYLAQPVSQPATTPTLTQPVIQSMAPDTVTSEPSFLLLQHVTDSCEVPVRGSKLVVKKFKTVKSDHIVLEDITWTTFIQKFLAIYELADQYSPGVHSGPGFKLSWTGSLGGKSGATTIENNHDFNVAILVLMKKKKTPVQVRVSSLLHLTWIVAMILSSQPHSLTEATVQDQDEELAYGTKVPRFNTFSEDAQLHAQYIIQLKKKWSCAKHQGEHGQDGHCYVSLTGRTSWIEPQEAQNAAGDATKHEPPNTADFDGARDGQLTDVKPCGCTGPRSSSSSTSDHTALLMAVMLPLLTKHLTSPNHDAPSTSSLVPTPATPSHVKNVPSPMKGINLLASKTVLMDLELTPDIIPEVPVAHLCEVLSAVEGRIIKFQVFCKEWNARLEGKEEPGLIDSALPTQPFI